MCRRCRIASLQRRHFEIFRQFHAVEVVRIAYCIGNRTSTRGVENRIVSALRQLEPDSVERLKTHIAVKGDIAVDPTTAALISRPTGKEIAALRKRIIPQVEWVFLGIGNCHQIFAFQRTAVAVERDGVLRLLALVRAGVGFLRRLRWDQREQHQDHAQAEYAYLSTVHPNFPLVFKVILFPVQRGTGEAYAFLFFQYVVPFGQKQYAGW